MTKRGACAATLAAIAAAGALAACDNSAQNADGATNTGDLGVAATTANQGVIADTGRDTGENNIGGAGELGVGGNSAVENATTGNFQ